MASQYNHSAIEKKWREKWEKKPINVNDGKKFEKILFDNLQKSEVLLVEMEEEKYVFKRIK